jgi:TolA-binding protein
LDDDGIKTLEAPPSLISEESSTPVERVDDLQRQLVVARGEVENLRYQLQQSALKQSEEMEALRAENEKLKEALNELGKKKAQQPKAQKLTATGGSSVDAQLWNQTKESIASGNYKEAYVTASSIRETYSKSKYFWGATLVSGMILYQNEQYKEAALIFDEAIDLASRRKRGVSLPWYFQGLNFHQLGKAEDAQLFWDELTRRYPRATVSRNLANLKKKKPFQAPKDLFKHLPNWEVFLRP